MDKSVNNLPKELSNQLVAINLDFATTNYQDAAKMTAILQQLLGIDLYFVLETKAKNNHYHLHSYFDNAIHQLTDRQISLTLIKYFGGKSFKLKTVFDLQGWRNYMSKNGNPIHAIIDGKFIERT